MTRSIATGLLLQFSVLLSGVLAARLLGPEDRGRLAIFLIVVLIVVQVGTIGLPVALTYYSAQRAGRTAVLTRRLLPTVLIQAALVVAAQAVILTVAFRDASGATRLAALITLLTGPALVAHIYGLAVLQGARAYRPYNAQRLMAPVLYSVGLVVLVAALGGDLGLVTVSAVYTATVLFTSALTVINARRVIRSVTSHGDDGPTRGVMARFGLRSLLGSFGAVEHLQLDQALVGLLLPARDIGLYVVAVAFTQLPRFLGASIGIVAYPEIAQTNRDQRRRRMWRVTVMAAALAAVVVAAEMLVMDRALPLAFGAEFASAIDTARILLIGAAFQMTRRVLSEASRGAGAPLAGTVAEVSLYVFIGFAVIVSERSLESISWAFTAASAGSLVVLLAAASLSTLTPRTAPA